MARGNDRTRRVTRADAMKGRSFFPKFNAVAKRFGTNTAFYQAGHLNGWDEGVRLAGDRSLKATDLLLKRITALASRAGVRGNPLADREQRAVKYQRSFFERAEIAAKKLGMRGESIPKRAAKKAGKRKAKRAVKRATKKAGKRKSK